MWLVLLCCALATSAQALSPSGCTRAPDGNRYRWDLQMEGVSIVDHFAFNWKTKTFYFSKYEISGGTVSGVAALGGKYSKIEELPHRCAFSVDQRLGEVYAGCRNESGRGGLYKLDSNTKKFVLLDERIRDANHIYFSDVLYYSDNDGNLYKYVNHESQLVAELKHPKVEEFVVDRDGDITFYADDSLYYRKVGAADTVQIADSRFMHAIIVAPDGSTYACNHDTIHRVNTTSAAVSPVVRASNCRLLATDRNSHFIYVDGWGNEVIRAVKCFSSNYH